MVQQNGHFLNLTTWAPPEVKQSELEGYISILEEHTGLHVLRSVTYCSPKPQNPISDVAIFLL